jgi:hypothetical protein
MAAIHGLLRTSLVIRAKRKRKQPNIVDRPTNLVAIARKIPIIVTEMRLSEKTTYGAVATNNLTNVNKE